MIGKSLLILCGGQEAIPAIIRAKNLGLRVIVCDGNSSAPGKQVCDIFITANIYDPDAIIAALSVIDIKIDGVITVAADNPVSVAKVKAFLGLKNANLEASIIASNKLMMKDSLLSAKLNVPQYFPIESLDQLKTIIQHEKSEFVLKPIDSRGSRGVIRLNSISECDFAYAFSNRYTKSRFLILEKWIDGFQLSSESIVWNGKSYLCGLADRNYGRLSDLYPYVVEDGGQTPSIHTTQHIIDVINQTIDALCCELKISSGTIKGDLVLRENKIYIIEFAFRLSGGGFCTVTIPHVYEYALVDNAIKIALDLAPDLPSVDLKPFKYQKNRFFFFKPGIINSVNASLLHDPCVIDHQLNITTGQQVDDITDHTLRHGFVNICTDSAAFTDIMMDKIMSSVQVNYV